MEPLVSICIPTHQGSRWIRDSIASALAQDYARVEVVVSDDHSTDGTAETAEAVPDERVRVVRSDRRLGMARNWNRSVQLARGDYIKFLMQDDLLDPTCVSRMATVLTAEPIGRLRVRSAEDRGRRSRRRGIGAPGAEAPGAAGTVRSAGGSEWRPGDLRCDAEDRLQGQLDR